MGNVSAVVDEVDFLGSQGVLTNVLSRGTNSGIEAGRLIRVIKLQQRVRHAVDGLLFLAETFFATALKVASQRREFQVN